MNKLQGKRIYDPYEEVDGYRILLDRLWPRGIRKADAHLDEWAKETAPSDELRKRFHADHDYEAFCRDYIQELQNNPSVTALISIIQEKLKDQNVTLLTASKDIQHCNLSVMMEYLQKNNEC